MAYMRDPDAASRGVGAIASVDHSQPSARAQRVQMGRALARRDRAMARIAQGALGAVDKRPTTSSSSPRGAGDKRQTMGGAQATVSNGIANAGSNSGGGNVHVITRGKNTNPTPIPTDRPTNVQQRAPRPAKDPGAGTPPGGGPPPGWPAGYPYPPPGWPPIAPTGGGSGTVGAGGSSLPTSPFPVSNQGGYPPLPQPTMPDAGLSVSGDDTMKLVMIAGGAALVAFLLFRSKETTP
jgi:hypothetical protein